MPTRPQTPPQNRAPRRRGSVLVAVLGIIALLSFLMVRFMDETIQDMEYRSLYNQPPEVRSFAYSLLEVTLATIQEVALIDDGKLHAPEQGWQDPLAYAGIQLPSGWEATITIQDEGGRLPINTVNQNRDLLIKLLEEVFEFDYGTTRELVSTLQDWIDEDDNRLLNGAESDDYLSLNPPYRAANAPLQSLDELRLINVWQDEFFDEDGQPNERFTQLESLVSVQHSGDINLNSAPQNVLDALAEGEDWQSDFLFDGIEKPYLTETPDRVDSSGIGVELELIRIDIVLQRADVPFALSALVQPQINPDSQSSASNLPGKEADDAPKTGSSAEQDALNIPFTILELNEYQLKPPPASAARYSAVDIEP